MKQRKQLRLSNFLLFIFGIIYVFYFVSCKNRTKNKVGFFKEQLFPVGGKMANGAFYVGIDSVIQIEKHLYGYYFKSTICLYNRPSNSFSWNNISDFEGVLYRKGNQLYVKSISY